VRLNPDVIFKGPCYCTFLADNCWWCLQSVRANMLILLEML